MYDHEFKINDRVQISLGIDDYVDGSVVKLWFSDYITVLTDDNERLAGPESMAQLICLDHPDEWPEQEYCRCCGKPIPIGQEADYCNECF